MILLNCSTLSQTKNTIKTIVSNWSENWGIYPNLGIGTPSPNGNIKNYESDEKYISLISYAVESGASLVGGCCGSSPKHIKMIKKLQKSYQNKNI